MQKQFYKELREKVAACGKEINPIVLFSHLLKTDKFYQKIARQTVEFSAQTMEELRCLEEGEALPRELMPSLMRTYHLCIQYLQDRRNLPMPSETLGAKYVGRMTAAFRAIDDKLSKIEGRALHYFCGCHLIDRNELAKVGKDTLSLRNKDDRLLIEKLSHAKQISLGWPTLENALKPLLMAPERENPRFALQGRSTVIYTCNIGMAHNAVQQTFAQRAAREGMHAYNLDGPDEVFLPLDFASQTLRLSFTDAAVYGWLQQKNQWGILKVLAWVFSGTPKAESVERRVTLAARTLLERAPDITMSAYSRNSGALAEASHRLGLSMFNSATDFDPELVDITAQSGAPRNRQFVHALFVDTVKSRNFLSDPETQQLVLKEDQIVVGGFPVRRSFIKTRSKEELQQLRERWHIDPEAQVVVIVSGGYGIANPYPEIVADYYQKTKRGILPNIHLFVVCGRNDKEKARLDDLLLGKKKTDGRNSMPRKQQAIPITILGWTDEESLGGLLALAADKNEKGREGLVLSAKAGGGTIAECAASKARVLASDLCPFEWERFNLEAFCLDGGLGAVFSKKEDMMPAFLSLLRSKKEPKIDFKGSESEGMSLTHVERLIVGAERDVAYQRIRTSLSRL